MSVASDQNRSSPFQSLQSSNNTATNHNHHHHHHHHHHQQQQEISNKLEHQNLRQSISPIKLKISTKAWAARQNAQNQPSLTNNSNDNETPQPHLPQSQEIVSTDSNGPIKPTSPPMEISDRGRPIRNRKPPDHLVATYFHAETVSRSRNRTEVTTHDNFQIDSMGRTRSAKTVLGTIDSRPSPPASPELPVKRSNRIGSGSRQSATAAAQADSNRLESDDKDADGEEEVEDDDDQADQDYDYENENGDVSFKPAEAADSGSDYQADTTNNQEAQDLSEESITIKRTRRQRTQTARVTIESDDSNFEPPEDEEEKEDDNEVEVVDSDDNGAQTDDAVGYGLRKRSKQAQALQKLARRRAGANGTNGATRRSARHSTRSNINHGDESDGQALPNTQEEEEGRQLRNRKHVDYHIPPLNAFEEDQGKSRPERSRGRKRLPMNMSGKELDRLFGHTMPGPDSDEEPAQGFGASRPNAGTGIFGPSAGGSGGFLGSGLLDHGGMATGPSNLGKVSDSANLADTDPLGLQANVDFSHVGGMDHHVQQLKEMVSLPLLYPEIFQRFQVSPPRGVLFHGPPGTGKTLLARALAASCSSEGQKISFFMRKGADCLSKWVGEAERQLRLLFEEAKNCQPSIIFFDEIDGLAPVRSSKQDQIHASIVSTLLSLMDGMDGRGQVVVIGATNRPDAVDPALRRPGRFDREFYFPLPNREARLSIINIHTRGWDPPLSESFKSELAELTKGYGGADLRALCTEAALNAVQRSYPQIYGSKDRLVIDPNKINVVARDFSIAQKHLIPSTHRSASSTSGPLPSQLLPILEDFLQKSKEILSKLLPDIKKPNILEEAKYEDDEAVGFEKENILRSFETLRVFKPRMAICGPKGSGQSYVGSAILHHLEGYHVQTLDLANLIGDSTIGPDARCVQVFAEAKRHKPSVIHIPSLHRWNLPVLETAKSTITSLLDELNPSDPILILGVMDCQFGDLPREIRSWFGVTRSNRIILEKPNPQQRKKYFAETIESIRRRPDEFPDGLPKKVRVLEVLPKAPPRAPRQPTESELASQLTQDKKLVEYLKFRLGPVMNELKKKHKRFTKPIGNSETAQSQPANDGATEESQPKFFPVDLESMHYKLYYNKYFTPQQFISDVEKIVYNAEQDCIMTQTGDYDLVVKAQAMLTHTRVMVEQACDAQFDVDCNRMFERMKLRDPQLGSEHKKSNKSNQNKATHEGPTRQSARTSGKEPEYLYDPQLNERGIKRLISISSSSPGESSRPSKRSKGPNDPVNSPPGSNSGERNDDGDVVGGEEEVKGGEDINERVSPSFQTAELFPHQQSQSLSQPQPTLDKSTTPDYDPDTASQPQNTVIENSDSNDVSMRSPQKSSQEIGRIEPGQFKNDNGWLEGTTVNEILVNQPSQSYPTDPEQISNPMTNQSHEGALFGSSSAGVITGPSPPPSAVAVVAAAAIAPSPPPPPSFTCPEEMVLKLKEKLEKGTQGLVVDRLEELRAGLFDVIWRFRKDWDRRSMISELVRAFDGYLSDVRQEELEEDEEENGVIGNCEVGYQDNLLPGW